MMDMEPLVAMTVAVVALVAATLSGVSGFGGAVVLLPALVWAVGPREAVPILTVAQVWGNLARVILNRHALDWHVSGRFILTAVPAAILGSMTFAVVSASVLSRVLGVFLLASVAYRLLRPGPPARFPLAGFLPLGAAFGFLSAVLGSIGPVVAPFFLAYGLVGSAYIGTEALTALAMHLTKTMVYGRLALVDSDVLVVGAVLGALLTVGSYLGKRILDRLPARWFARLIEIVLVIAGFQLLFAG